MCAADPVAARRSAASLLCSITVIAALRWSDHPARIGYAARPARNVPVELDRASSFGQLVPAGIGGDAVRVWLVCRTGLSVRVALASILGDRLMGLLAILLIVTIEVPALRRLIGTGATFSALIVTLGVGYGIFLAIVFLDVLARAAGTGFVPLGEITHVFGKRPRRARVLAWIPVHGILQRGDSVVLRLRRIRRLSKPASPRWPWRASCSLCRSPTCW